MASRIRVKASAVLLRDFTLLLIAFRQGERVFYNLPGGVIEPGESAFDALRREVREETGAEIAGIGRLLLTWEYEPQRHNYRYGDKHRIGLVFMAALAEGSEPDQPPTPDLDQIGVRWLALDQLHSVELHPDIAGPLIAAIQGGDTRHIVV
jgi:8-oxo-dGTP diphosphatase